MERQHYIRQELERTAREWAIKAALLGAAVFLALSALDFVSVPEHAWRFLGYRVAAAGGLVAIAAIAQRSRRMGTVRLLILCGALLGAATLEAMILQFGGHHSPYLIGMVLLVVMMLGLIPVGAGLAALIGGAIFAIYLLPIFAWDRIQEVRYFAVETALFGCVILAAVVIRYLNMAQLTREISLRHDLLGHQERLEAEVSQRLETERGLSEEIEQRRRGEERLRLFAAAVESAADGISITDLRGTLISCNPAAAAQFGLAAEGLPGKNARDLLANPALLDRAILPDLLRLGTWAGEVVSGLHAGRSTTLWVTASLIRGSDGQPTAALLVSKDLAMQRLIDEHHIKTQKLESVGVLAGGLAHDFNNLLTIILGNLDLARLFAGGNSDITDALDHASEASLRAGDLTRQLITFSKGGQPVKRVADIRQLLQETVAFASSGSNVACALSLPEELPPVEFDEGQMRQVVHNLVQNAREAMPEGGTIRVSARAVDLRAGEIPSLAEGSYVRLDFTDHGTGISREHLHQIFDPYFSTKEMGAAKGRGLGLAVTYSIIRSHGGAITVDTHVGGGTTFSLFLPTSAGKPVEDEDEGAEGEDPAPAEAALARAGDAATEQSPAGAATQPLRGRILVMDDEVLVLEMAGAALRKMGYGAELCRDGAEAVVRYQVNLDAGRPFDAVILDLTVPGGMGGLDAIRRLRELDPKVCAALSSGYTSDPIATGYRNAGFKAFVAKPYSLKTLEEFLAALV